MHLPTFFILNVTQIIEILVS